jgi:hypothetical protein
MVARTYVSLALGFAAILAAPRAGALTQPFGPKTYTVARNAHVQAEETIFAASPCDNVHAVYTLTVDARSATAHVSLNGREIIVTTGHDAKQVQLTGSNALSVDATGAVDADGSVTVAVTRKLDAVDGDAPIVTITDIKDGGIVTAAALPISGTLTDASGIASLTINGQSILPAGRRRSSGAPKGSGPDVPSGGFALKLGLKPGANVITIDAEDCGGNVRHQTITVYYDAEPPQVSITSPLSGALINANSVLASGAVNDDVGVDHVTVNGVTAVLRANNTWAAAVTFPGDGSRQLTAIAVDKAGRESKTSIPLTVDATPPLITASVSPAPNAAGWNRATTIVTFTCDDATTGVATCADAVIINEETPGRVVAGTAVDKAGNEATATLTVKLDRTPPLLDVPTPSAVIDPTVTITGTASDILSGIAGVTCNGTAGTLSAGGAFTCNVTGLVQGVNDIGVAAIDVSGNVTTTGLHVTFATDREPPHVTITSPAPASYSNTTNVLVTGTATDDVAVAGVTVNGISATLNGNNWSATVPLTGEGPHDLTAVATDKSAKTATAKVTITVDVTPPQINAASSPAPNPAGWWKTDPTVTFTCSDGGSGIATCSGGVTVTTETAQQTVSGTAVDKAGNQATASVVVKLDKTIPVIDPAVAPPANASGWVRGPASIIFVCTDAMSGIADCTAPVRLPDGANQSALGHATDLAGNVAAAALSANVDSAAPLLQLESPAADSIVKNGTVAVSGTVSDTGAGLAQVTCNGVAATVTSGRFDCSATLEQGLNQLVVVARDKAGNMASQRSGVQLDNAPPEVAIVAPTPSSRVAAGTVHVVVTATDDDAIASVTIGGTAATQTAAGYEADVNVAEGSNQIAVAATDRAGNSTTAQVALTRYSLPSIAITSPADLSTLTTSSVTVSGTVNDPAATVRVNGIVASVGGGTFSAANVPLEQGRTVITAVAANALGHTLSANVLVYRDSIPPRIRIYTPPEGSTVYSPAVSITGMVDDIVVGTINAAQVNVTINGQPAQVLNRGFLATNVALAAGPNTIVVSATDQGGNTASVQHHLTYDAGVGLAHIEILSGNDQSAAIGALLGQPLKVRLLDAAGAPAATKTVAFRVVSDTGRVKVGATTGRIVSATTDAQGIATATWTLGMRAGAGTNRVAATAAGFAGTASFEAVAAVGPPDRIVADAGDEQFGATSTMLPRPLIVVAIDAGNNRATNVPVTFRVLQGGGSFGGQQTAIVNSDSDGRAWIAPALGAEAGNDNNVFEASINGGASAVRFHASGRTPGDPLQTRISGVIVDNTNIPIEGVSVRIQGTPFVTQTNAQGQFSLSGTPVGYVKLFVDGSTTLRPGTWPTLEYAVYPIAGIDNTIGMPIYLLPIDIAHGVSVDETHGGTITLPDVPGFSLTILPGSVTFAGGSRTGTVSCTSVHPDKIPMSPGFGQQPRFIFTTQPPGAHFDPPAQLNLPNLEGLAPGEITEMYSFDHDLGQFVTIGTGSVSDDGSVIRSDPGVGIFKSGWGCGGSPNTSGAAATPVVAVSPDALVIGEGNTTVLTASGAPSPPGAPAYVWSSAQNAIAFVGYDAGYDSSSNPSRGLVKGITAGQTLISATYRTDSGSTAVKSTPVTVVSVKEIDATLDSNASVSGGPGGPEIVVKQNGRSLNFAPPITNHLVVLKGSGMLKFTAIDVLPASAPSLLRWSIKRNFADAVPHQLLPKTSSGATASVELKYPGSFIMVLSVDTNKNGALDDGEEIRTMPFAIVDVSLRAGAQFSSPNTIAADPQIAHFQTTNAMGIEGTVDVVGGGPNGLIGLDLGGGGGGMVKVQLGVLQNLMSDTMTGTFINPTVNPTPPPSFIKHGFKDPAGNPVPFPMLDAAPPATTGGQSAFLLAVSNPVVPTSTTSSLGRAFTVKDGDNPTQACFQGSAPFVMTTCVGQLTFQTAFAAVADFNRTYMLLGKGTWGLNLSGTLSGGPVLTPWQLNSSGNNVVLNGTSYPPNTGVVFSAVPAMTPARADDAGFQVYPPVPNAAAYPIIIP